jgi:hypothetical protein
MTPSEPPSEPLADDLFAVEGLGAAFARGAAAGFVLVFVGSIALTLAAGIETGMAVAVSLFAAFWAGFGLGGMYGAISRTHALEQ